MCLQAHCRVTLHDNELTEVKTDLVSRELLFATAGREDDLHHLGVAVEEGGLARGPPNIVLQAGGAEGFGHFWGKIWKLSLK